MTIFRGRDWKSLAPWPLALRLATTILPYRGTPGCRRRIGTYLSCYHRAETPRRSKVCEFPRRWESARCVNLRPSFSFVPFPSPPTYHSSLLFPPTVPFVQSSNRPITKAAIPTSDNSIPLTKSTDKPPYKVSQSLAFPFCIQSNAIGLVSHGWQTSPSFPVLLPHQEPTRPHTSSLTRGYGIFFIASFPESSQRP